MYGEPILKFEPTVYIIDSIAALMPENMAEEIDGISVCPMCGERFLEDEGYTYNGELYCRECYEDIDIRTCPHCGEDFSAYDGYRDEKTGTLYCCKCCCEEATGKKHRWFL